MEASSLGANRCRDQNGSSWSRGRLLSTPARKKKKKDRPVSGEQYYSTLLARTMASLKSPGAFALQTAASPYVVAESASVLVQ